MTGAVPPCRGEQKSASTEKPPPFWSSDEQVFGVLAAIATLLGLAWLMSVLGSAAVAVAISLAVPVALGVLVGVFARSASAVIMIGLLLGAIGIVVAGLWTLECVGVFCGAIYAVIAFGPGLCAGLIVLGLRRRRAWHHRHGKRWLGPLLIVVPLSVHAVERAWPAVHAPEHILEVREFAAPVERVFGQSLAFGASPASPWEAIHAPLPRNAIGRASAVGDVKSMVFDKGVITVRVSAVEPGRRLVAEVIEQTIERRALLLSTVTVTCEPIGPERTRVMLRLDFVPCMGPRWYWRPFERWFGGIAFDAVFDAWEREVCEPVATPGG